MYIRFLIFMFFPFAISLVYSPLLLYGKSKGILTTRHVIWTLFASALLSESLWLYQLYLIYVGMGI